MATTGTEAFGKRPGARPTRAPATGGRLPPLWPWALAALIAEILLQWFPVTGVFLMMLGAPLWSVVLVNLVLVLFAVDAWRGAMPRWLVAVPAAIYLANFAASAASYLEYRSLVDDVARQNAAQRLPFDPTREALVITGGSGEDLVLDYRIPVVFTPNPNAAPASNLSLRAAPKSVCDEIGAAILGPVQAMPAVSGGRVYDNLCLLRMFEDPALPVVSLSASKQTGVAQLLTYEMTTVRAVGPDGQAASRQVGVAGVLSPIPQPVIGCVLNDAQNRWQCVADLVRLRVGIGGQPGAKAEPPTAGVIAALLALQPRSLTVTHKGGFFPFAKVRADPSEFDAASQAQVTALADQLLQAQTAADIRQLPDYLAGGPTEDNGFATTLARHADQVASFADRMSAAYEQAVDSDQSNRVYTLGTILAALPEDDFARVGPRLLQVAGGQGERRPVPETLIARFGDLAPASTPYLRRLLAGRDGMAIDGAILALCRAGANAQADGPAIVAALRLNSGVQSREAAFVALRRMGRFDLAQTIEGPRRAFDHAYFEGDAAQITPDSPRTVCRLGGAIANNLPDVAWLR